MGCGENKQSRKEASTFYINRLLEGISLIIVRLEVPFKDS